MPPSPAVKGLRLLRRLSEGTSLPPGPAAVDQVAGGFLPDSEPLAAILVGLAVAKVGIVGDKLFLLTPRLPGRVHPSAVAT